MLTVVEAPISIEKVSEQKETTIVDPNITQIDSKKEIPKEEASKEEVKKDEIKKEEAKSSNIPQEESKKDEPQKENTKEEKEDENVESDPENLVKPMDYMDEIDANKFAPTENLLDDKSTNVRILLRRNV